MFDCILEDIELLEGRSSAWEHWVAAYSGTNRGKNPLTWSFRSSDITDNISNKCDKYTFIKNNKCLCT